mmetsp:Transcript_5813/g.6932  ORF Transcript_5813/g.6932 Transcript_5813/m.6932 type:complete len:277 (-) Transcript_5813:16-846(-)
MAKLNQLVLGDHDLVASLHQMVLQVVHDEVNRNSVLLGANLGSAPRHNNVCILHRRLYKLREGRLHVAVVRLENTVDGSASLHDVSLKTARQTNVIVSVNKNFQVKHLVDLFVVEAENALEDDERGPFALQARHIALASHIVVVRDGHVFPATQLLQRLFDQVPVEHRGMVEVDLANISHLLRRALLVKAVDRDEGALLELADAHALKYLVCNRRLARGRAACDAHEDCLALSRRLRVYVVQIYLAVGVVGLTRPNAVEECLCHLIACFTRFFLTH